MRFSTFDLTLWAAGFFLNGLLLGVLLLKRRAPKEPWFTAWIALGCVSTAILFFAYRSEIGQVYFVLYWFNVLLDLMLQLGVIAEIARSVLCRNDSWVENARDTFTRLCLASVVVATLATVLTTPAVDSFADGIFARSNLFMTVLFCFMFGSVMAVSNQLGLAWNNRATRVGAGLAVWNLASFLTDTLHAYWRTMSYFNHLEHARTITFQLVSVYWIALHLAPEPDADVPSEEVLRDLAALRGRFGGPAAVEK